MNRGKRGEAGTAAEEELATRRATPGLAGVSRIETVFRAHVGDDCEVLAASD